MWGGGGEETGNYFLVLFIKIKFSELHSLSLIFEAAN